MLSLNSSKKLRRSPQFKFFYIGLRSLKIRNFCPPCTEYLSVNMLCQLNGPGASIHQNVQGDRNEFQMAQEVFLLAR